MGKPLLLFLLLTVSIQPRAAFPEEQSVNGLTQLTIATGETPPLASQNKHNFGYLNDIVSSAFREVGVQVNYEFLPWSRAYSKTREGGYIASSYWFDDEKHEAFFYKSLPVSQESIRFYFHSTLSEKNIKNLSDVKRLELKLGLTRGYTYNAEVWAYADSVPARVSVVNSELQNLMMLALGRIDVYPGEPVIVDYILKTHLDETHRDNIKHSQHAYLSRTSHLMFSRQHVDSKAYLNLFNQGLTRITENGQLKQITINFKKGLYH